MKIYVAGGWKERETVIRPYMERLRTAGHEITKDWTVDDTLPGWTAGMTDADLSTDERIRRATEDLTGVVKADVLWLVFPSYVGSIGSAVELGFGYGLKSRNDKWPLIIVVSGAEKKRSIFVDLADKLFDDHEEAFRFICAHGVGKMAS